MRDEIKELCSYIRNKEVTRLDLTESKLLSNEDLKALLQAIQENWHIKELTFPSSLKKNILCQTIQKQIKINQENLNKKHISKEKPTEKQFTDPIVISLYEYKFPQTLFPPQKRAEYLNTPLFLLTFIISLIALNYGIKIADYFLRSLQKNKNNPETITKIYEELFTQLEKYKPTNLFFQQTSKENKIKILSKLWAFSELTLDLEDDMRKKLTTWSIFTNQYVRSKNISTKEYNRILNTKEKLLEKYASNENQKKSKFH